MRLGNRWHSGGDGHHFTEYLRSARTQKRPTNWGQLGDLSGETGIRTLGTLAGTPVFKTGLHFSQTPTQPRVTQNHHIRGARIGAELSGASLLGPGYSFGTTFGTKVGQIFQ